MLIKIHGTSPFTGKTHTQDIPVTEEQLKVWENGALIQKATTQDDLLLAIQAIRNETTF